MSTRKKQLNETQRNLIIDLHKNGLSYRKIEMQTKISFSTVKNIVQKFKKHGTVADLSGRGRKRKTSSRIDRYIVSNVKEKRFQTAAHTAADIKTQFGVLISDQTIRNRLHEKGLRCYVPRKKPFLTKRHMKNRLEFAKKYVNMPLIYWKKVLFSDESKFNMHKNDGPPKVWRAQGDAYNISCMRGTVKHGGGNVMVWGSMAWNGVGKLTFIDTKMDAELYISILKQNLKSSARKLRLGTNFVFQQDNDPKHTAKKTKEFFEKNHVNVLEWPSQSPDLNPIEHLWAVLDREIGPRKLSKKDDLKLEITNAWERINKDVSKKLVESMPKRLQAVITAKGGPTKY